MLISDNIDELQVLDGEEKRTENQNTIAEETIIQEPENMQLDWYIEIPSISLKAPIAETVEMEVLNNTVGHFENMSKDYGNIGLAGHNRGYENNYFENLKKVNIGDEIFYKYNDFENTYIVDKIELIKDTNWDYLCETEENKVTLITCVENMPEYRRCVQATQKEK